MVVGYDDFYVILHVRIPLIYANNSFWGGMDCSCPGRWDAHDIV